MTTTPPRPSQRDELQSIDIDLEEEDEIEIDVDLSGLSD
jgi:hypothetical protein